MGMLASPRVGYHLPLTPASHSLTHKWLDLCRPRGFACSWSAGGPWVAKPHMSTSKYWATIPHAPAGATASHHAVAIGRPLHAYPAAPLSSRLPTLSLLFVLRGQIAQQMCPTDTLLTTRAIVARPPIPHGAPAIARPDADM